VHIRPPDGGLSSGPARTRLPRTRRQRSRLRLMIAGSLLLHALILAAFFEWPETDQNTGPEDVAANDVSLVIQSGATAPASTKSPDALPTPTVAQGAQTDQVAPKPTPQTAVPAQASAAPTPPAPPPPTPAPEPPAPPVPTPPPPPPPPTAQAPPPVVEASIPPPDSTVPDTTPPPPTPAQPPEVSLTTPPPPQEAIPEPPAFVMPQPPPPLPQPKPVRPSPPRRVARPQPRSPSGFPMPENYALNRAPAPLASHGFDSSPSPRGGQDDESYKHIGGADPGPDWLSELHRWAAAHAFYPQEAAQEGQEGSVTVQVEIDHFGHVLNVDMVSRSGSQWLDLAWLGQWRHATVPSFPQGTMGDTTTLQYTINYILIRH
jgi:TonB family protein